MQASELVSCAFVRQLSQSLPSIKGHGLELYPTLPEYAKVLSTSIACYQELDDGDNKMS